MFAVPNCCSCFLVPDDMDTPNTMLPPSRFIFGLGFKTLRGVNIWVGLDIWGDQIFGVVLWISITFNCGQMPVIHQVFFAYLQFLCNYFLPKMDHFFCKK